MILPHKFENPTYNSLKIAADVINYLKQEKNDINKLYKEFEEHLSIEKFLDVLVFLFIIGKIDLIDNKLVLINETT